MKNSLRRGARKLRERSVPMRAVLLLAALMTLILLISAVRGLHRMTVLMGTDAPETLVRELRFHRNLLLAAAVLLTAALAGFDLLVLRPLKKMGVRMIAGEKLPLEGSYELRNLARSYNTVFAANERENDHLLYQAEHDPLTGLYNRGAFDKLRASHHDERIGLLIIDVDHFKGVNDTYGHETGDRVLQKVARILSGSFRSSDYPCRIGGDEFSVIISDLSPSPEVIRGVLRRKMRDAAAALADTSDGLPAVTLSVGAAMGEQCVRGEDIFQLADAALYQVKERGRNGFAFYGEL